MYFPNDEYEKRLKLVRERMRAQGVDLLLQFGQEAVCWISGFYTPAYFAYAALGIPLEGEPFLVLRFMEEAAAKTSCWVDKRYPYKDDADPVALTAECVRNAGLSTARIAVDKDSWYLTVNRYEKLTAVLPDAIFCGDQQLVETLRILKSPLEIERIKSAARIVEAGLRGAIAATRVNTTERDVAAAMAHARLVAGSDLPIDGVLTTGERTLEEHGPWTDRKLREGDQLFYEFHGIKDHYWARLLRSGVLGKPTPEQLFTAKVILDAQNAAFIAMRPGVHAAVIDKICRQPMIDAGLERAEDYTNRIGYGLGLNFRPSPGEFIREFTPSADFLLEEGMVFHMVQSAKGIGFSDTVVVTAEGAQLLTQYPRELFCVEVS